MLTSDFSSIIPLRCKSPLKLPDYDYLLPTIYRNMRCRQISLAIGRRDPLSVSGNKTALCPLQASKHSCAVSISQAFLDSARLCGWRNRAKLRWLAISPTRCIFSCLAISFASFPLTPPFLPLSHSFIIEICSFLLLE